MLPILQIGPLAIQTPGLILLIGLWFGLTLSEKLAQAEKKVDSNSIFNLAMIALLTGVAGARLFYAARFPDAFIENPLSLISPNTVMLDSTGGLVSAGLAALIYGQRRKLPLWATLDAFTPALCVFAIAIGLAHFASGDAFGIPARLPWSIRLWGEYRHPTQLYETLLALVVTILVWPRPSIKKWTGLRFLLFITLSALARIVVESFRGDSAMVFNTVRSAQIVAWFFLAISLALIGARIKSEIPEENSQVFTL